jgi:hypothetical protein
MQLTTDDVKKIDIQFLNKNGYLDRLGQSQLSWRCNGEPTGTIGYLMMNDRMTLNYQLGKQSFRYDVAFDKTACHLGGYRKWLKCPTCSRRCGVLYLTHLVFKCRKCSRLPYLSTLQSDIDRLIEQKHKLGYRTFERYDGDGIWKKKHMQQKTFERLEQRYIKLDRQIDAHIGIYLKRLSLK